jgi:predicted metalloprotease with PDZ domain
MARTRYRLAIPRPDSHLVEVEARFLDVGGLAQLDLRMAGWTPGSYLVRDYARHVEGLVAEADGQPLPVEKVEKAIWRVRHGGAREVTVRYRVYAFELTVRTSHVDGTHAFLNGAPTYLWLDERRGEPHAVALELPPAWRVVTGLPREGEAWIAADLDELIDSPFHAGDGPVLELQAGGRPHELAIWGRPDAGGVATLDTLAADTKKIVEEHARVFGGLPYDRYAFVLMLAPGAYGGLEHRCSTALLSNPFAFATRKRYEELLELVSHEHFHLWNVKRIHPRALGPFDYTRESYTRSLWIVEGLTSYYDRYALRRAGLVPTKRYLEKLAEEWDKVLALPGRRKQSLEESSFDAWIKLYRPDENSANSTVSYYLKGSLVCLCLDLEIRRRSEGRRSLDDVLRVLWGEYGQPARGYADDEVQGVMERATGLDLGAFFDAFVRGHEDPDLAGALGAAGLILRPKQEKDADEEQRPGWLGALTRSDGGRVIIATVLEGTPAARGGLYAGDELVAIDGYRVDERSLPERLSARRPGAGVTLTVFRRDELRALEVTLGDKPPVHEITRAPGATASQLALRRAWLGDDD